MPIKITIDGVTRLDKGIWKAKIDPSELSLFGTCSNDFEGMNILLIIDPKEVIEASGKLIFDPQKVRILNKGCSMETIILKNIETEKNTDDINQYSSRTINSGDKKFLKDLQSVPILQELGGSFLKEARNNFAGELKFHPISKRFVESPDNFWTVKIQPRDVSLRFTVRGFSNQFEKVENAINITNDRKGYSTFKLMDQTQIPDVIRVLKRASTI